MRHLNPLTRTRYELALALSLQVHNGHVHYRPEVRECLHGGEKRLAGGVLGAVQTNQSAVPHSGAHVNDPIVEVSHALGGAHLPQ